jgi:hypothetical protein
MRTALKRVGAVFGLALLLSASMPVWPQEPSSTESPTRAQQFAALPDWRGVWFYEGAQDAGISGILSNDAFRPPIMNPGGPWKDESRAQLFEIFAQSTARKANGWGFPMMMSSLTPLQFVVTPDEVLVLTAYRDLRHIYTDQRPLSAEEDREPSTWGESIGHWEGDTLVIETVAVRRPAVYSQVGPPLSDNARYIERLRKTGADRMELEMMIEDPATLTAPHSFKVAYVRAEGLDRLFYDDFTNDRSELENGVFAILPPKEKQ